MLQTMYRDMVHDLLPDAWTEITDFYAIVREKLDAQEIDRLKKLKNFTGWEIALQFRVDRALEGLVFNGDAQVHRVAYKNVTLIRAAIDDKPLPVWEYLDDLDSSQVHVDVIGDKLHFVVGDVRVVASVTSAFAASDTIYSAALELAGKLGMDRDDERKRVKES